MPACLPRVDMHHRGQRAREGGTGRVAQGEWHGRQWWCCLIERTLDKWRRFQHRLSGPVGRAGASAHISGLRTTTCGQSGLFSKHLWPTHHDLWAERALQHTSLAYVPRPVGRAGSSAHISGLRTTTCGQSGRFRTHLWPTHHAAHLWSLSLKPEACYYEL